MYPLIVEVDQRERLDFRAVSLVWRFPDADARTKTSVGHVRRIVQDRKTGTLRIDMVGVAFFRPRRPGNEREPCSSQQYTANRQRIFYHDRSQEVGGQSGTDFMGTRLSGYLPFKSSLRCSARSVDDAMAAEASRAYDLSPSDIEPDGTHIANHDGIHRPPGHRRDEQIR